MGLAYFAQEDVHMRLNRTICRYHGEPVYVEVDHRHPLNTVLITSIPSGGLGGFRQKRILTTDQGFVHRSPELGYVNVKVDDRLNCYYYARSPKRKQQQGLCAGNVDVLNEHGPSFADVWLTEGFRNLIVNVYPKFDEALKSVLDGDVKGVAFHRHACIRKLDGHNVSLYFKERMVAMYYPRMQCFNLLPGLRDGSYLNAFFHKIGVPI